MAGRGHGASFDRRQSDTTAHNYLRERRHGETEQLDRDAIARYAEFYSVPRPSSIAPDFLAHAHTMFMPESDTHLHIAGNRMAIFLGAGTDRVAVSGLLKALHSQTSKVIPTIVCYDRHGHPFSHCLVVSPIPSLDVSIGSLARITSHPISAISGCLCPDDSLRLHLAISADTTMALLEVMETGITAMPEDDSPTISATEEGTAALVPAFGYDPLGARYEVAFLTSAEPPYVVLWVSPAWVSLCGFSTASMVGGDLRCIQGPSTSRKHLDTLMSCVRSMQSCTVHGMINYDRNRQPISHTLHIEHLPSERDGRPSMFRATWTDVMYVCTAGLPLFTWHPDDSAAAGCLSDHPAGNDQDTVVTGQYQTAEQEWWGEELEDYMRAADKVAAAIGRVHAAGEGTSLV